MHILRFREKKSLANARKNRLEIIKAQLSRREMIRAGLAAAEAAVGLAIIIAVYRTRETLNVDQVNLLKL